MPNRRIEYDPDDGSDYAEALAELGTYRDAEQSGDWSRAASAADRAADLTERMADAALLHALDTQSERTVAAGMGLPRPTLQYRIKRARTHLGDGTDHSTGDDPDDEVDEDGTWTCPECHNDGTPNGCALCHAVDGND